MNSSKIQAVYEDYRNEVMYEFMLWIHPWIPTLSQWYEECSEFMAGFLKINSHMKSWLNSLNLNGSGFRFKSVSVREQILTNQSNNDLFFAFISLPALRLLCCCSLMATGLCCCNCSQVLWCTTGWGRLEGLDGLHWTLLEWRWWQLDLPGQLVSNEGNFWNLQVERDQPQGNYPDKAIKSSEGFLNARHNSKCHPIHDVGIHLEQFSWRMLPPCSWMQHYANKTVSDTVTSKVQVTVQEAQGAQ